MSGIAIVLVVAAAENGVIGRDGALPWRLASDLKHFRAVTMGKPILMGRRTWLSLPRRPLPGRTNIVLTRDAAFAAPGALVTRSFDAALEAARGDALRRGADAVAVIGGAEVFALALPLADRIELTRVRLSPAGDTWFPPPDPTQWREEARRDAPAGPQDDAAFSVLTYRRVVPAGTNCGGIVPQAFDRSR